MNILFQQSRIVFYFVLVVPENVEDELIGTITFNERFTTRYGPIHPAFYQGTLDDALKEACNKPAKEVSTFRMASFVNLYKIYI